MSFTEAGTTMGSWSQGLPGSLPPSWSLPTHTLTTVPAVVLGEAGEGNGDLSEA